jgi:hypothetical protein
MTDDVEPPAKPEKASQFEEPTPEEIIDSHEDLAVLEELSMFDEPDDGSHPETFILPEGREELDNPNDEETPEEFWAEEDLLKHAEPDDDNSDELGIPEEFEGPEDQGKLGDYRNV